MHIESNQFIEFVGLVFGLLFLIFLINEKIICWVFGILSSLIGIYLFIETKLYSEAILYSYYVLVGIYGWRKWLKGNDGSSLEISKKSIVYHISSISIGFILSMLLGYGFSKTDANNPYADAFTTIFSFIATYLEANKFLYGWIYWIIINGFSIWLYNIRGLNLYAILALIYFFMSIWGFLKWRKKYYSLIIG